MCVYTDTHICAFVHVLQSNIYVYIYTHVCVFVFTWIYMPPHVHDTTGWRRPIGCLILIGHFLQKSPIISGSFAKNRYHLEQVNQSNAINSKCVEIGKKAHMLPLPP